MPRGGGGSGGGAAGRKRLGEHHDGNFGVYMAHKIQKLRGQNKALAESSPGGAATTDRAADALARLFRGVHVYVDGYTVPSKEEIRQLMLRHGGGFEHYETSRVTHLIATHLPASKLLQLKKTRRSPPVVHPDWIVQSIEQKKLLGIQQFLYAGFADPTQRSLFSLSSVSSASGEASRFPSCVSSLSAASPAKSKAPGEPGEQSTPSGAHTASNRAVDQSPKDVEDERDDAAFLGFDGDEEDEEEENHWAVVDEAPPAAGMTTTAPNSEPLRPKTWTNSTRDGPEFVRHFFAKSRLHHIGTWRSTFQQKAAEFQAKYTGSPVRRASPSSSNRVILHVDMDCFFVAVAVRGHPELQKVPVAVAHSANAGSSEISSCNYLARAKGVSAGMFMQSAKELCPELVVLPYQFEAIQRVSFQIYDIFFSHTPFVQAVSCDEAFLEFGAGTDGLQKAEAIREQIREQTDCAASVGVSFNALMAKLGSKKAKPDGVYCIAGRDQAEAFMLTLRIRDLPGVGYRTAGKFNDLGVEDLNQLLSVPKNDLIRHFGKATGEMFFNFARGVDRRPLSLEDNLKRKSVSAVVNFGIRFDTWEDSTTFLVALGKELGHRLRSFNMRTKCLTLQLKKRREGQPLEPAKFMGHGVCDSFSKSQVLAQATDDDQVIAKTSIALLQQFNFPSNELRGVGIQATKLVSDASNAVNQRDGQRIKAWLADSAQSTTTSSPTGEHGEAKTEERPREAVISNGCAAETLSQVNMGVLEELPPTLRKEILASFGRVVPANPRQPGRSKCRANGKAPLRRKTPGRNILDSTERSAQFQGPRTTGNGDALNDIAMSQIDSEVYHSLPFAIRREIDKYTKKRRPASTVAALKRPESQSSSNLEQTLQKPTVYSPPIEELFSNVLESVEAEITASGGGGEEHAATIVSAQTAVFDTIYLRILVEVESRALDRALRMLRFVRRKCASTNNAEPLQEVLKHGFNQILDHVTQDIRRHFSGTLASSLVAPLT